MGVEKGLGLTERQRFWLGHVCECEREGMSSSVYAKAHGLSVTSLYNARKMLREKGALPPQRSKGPRFARVTLAPGATPSTQAVCRVHLPNGCTVEWQGEADEHTVGGWLRAASALS